MVRYFKGSVKFNEGSRILTQYKSTLPHPHCNTNTHINNVSVETIRHLETGALSQKSLLYNNNQIT
mgnify:CR=1 FL=1